MTSMGEKKNKATRHDRMESGGKVCPVFMSEINVQTNGSSK